MIVLSHLNHARLCNLWTVARQAPLCMDSQGSNTGVQCRTPPGDLPDPGDEAIFPASVSYIAGSFLTH